MIGWSGKVSLRRQTMKQRLEGREDDGSRGGGRAFQTEQPMRSSWVENVPVSALKNIFNYKSIFPSR